MELVAASTGEQAVARAAESPADLAIADLVLAKPGFSGAYTLVRIREICPDCRTILVSDHDYVGSLVAEVTDLFLVRPSRPSSSALGLRLAGLVNDLLADRQLEIPAMELGPAESLVTTIDGPLSTQDSTSALAGGSPRPDPQAGGSQDGARARHGRRLIAGKYRLEDELGRGGMGVVFRAEDIFIQRPVAVKLLRMSESAKKADERQRRMHREVMITGRLAHPHIVTVHDAGFDGADIYLVMALIEGPTLGGVLEQKGPLPRPEAVAIALQVLEALSYAHGKGVVHRDLKPSNVLITPEGTVQVADFGLAKIRSLAAEDDDPPSAALESLTASGVVLGTLAYMAPEQMLGWASDPRSDLYSLGAILFEMLHGQPLARVVPPIRAAASLRLRQALDSLPELPGEPELDRHLKRALALDPGDRFETCGALAAELRALGD